MTWFMEKLRNIDKELLTTASLGNMQKIVKLLEKTITPGTSPRTMKTITWAAKRC